MKKNKLPSGLTLLEIHVAKNRPSGYQLIQQIFLPPHLIKITVFLPKADDIQQDTEGGRNVTKILAQRAPRDCSTTVEKYSGYFSLDDLQYEKNLYK